MVLGMHQLVESVVWWGLEGRISDGVWQVARCMPRYTFRARPGVGAVGGRCTGGTPDGTADQMAHHAGGSGGSHADDRRHPRADRLQIEGHHIDYDVDLWQGGLLVVFYVVATCGSLLLSEHARVRRFGMVNLAVVVALAALDQGAFISLWCAWAAVTSLAISLQLREVGRHQASPRRDGRR